MTKLRNANVSYCARTGIGGGPVDSGCTTGCTEGSIWTGGVSGQGIQLHGEFDWSTLSRNNTASMDYCATPTIPGVTKRVADHDRWRSMRVNASDGGECAGGTRAAADGSGCASDHSSMARGRIATMPNGTRDGDTRTPSDDAAAASGRQRPPPGRRPRTRRRPEPASAPDAARVADRRADDGRADDADAQADRAPDAARVAHGGAEHAQADLDARGAPNSRAVAGARSGGGRDAAATATDDAAARDDAITTPTDDESDVVDDALLSPTDAATRSTARTRSRPTASARARRNPDGPDIGADAMTPGAGRHLRARVACISEPGRSLITPRRVRVIRTRRVLAAPPRRGGRPRVALCALGETRSGSRPVATTRSRASVASHARRAAALAAALARDALRVLAQRHGDAAERRQVLEEALRERRERALDERARAVEEGPGRRVAVALAGGGGAREPRVEAGGAPRRSSSARAFAFGSPCAASTGLREFQ